MLKQTWVRARQEWLLLTLLAALPPLLWALPGPLPALDQLVHWQTLGALAGLMVLSRGLQDSGYLFLAGRWLLERTHNERRLASMLVVFSAALSMLITNDVALFIVVPLTLGLASAARLPIGRLVVFEALAVNAGSAASPIGNPQNLFLWQSSGTSFLEFGLAMAPLGAGLVALLLLVVPLAFASTPLDVTERLPAPAAQRRLLWLSLALYPPFLALAELGSSNWAAIGVIAIYLLLARPVLRGVDWPLLAVFLLMFIDLGLVARLPSVLLLAADLATAPGGMLTLGVLLSQLISNVPAAIFLADFTDDWRTLAWAVSIGGFGLATGSMANLIALRLARAPGLWWDFHRWSVPLLAGAWLLAWLILQGLQSGLA